MITRVRVRNFRSIASADVSLGNLTVLVGRNGAGKSAFLDVLRFVRDSLAIGLENAVLIRKGIAAIRRWAPGRRFDIEIGLTINAPRFFADCSFVLASQRQGGYRVKRETCRVGRSAEEIQDEFELRNGKWILPPRRLRSRPGSLADDGSESAPPVDPGELVLGSIAFFSPDFLAVRGYLRGGFYNFFPGILREPQKPYGFDFLKDHGENLASVLQHLQRDGRWWPDLVAALGRVVEGITDLRVRDVGGFLVTELKHGEGEEAPWFELAQESDGTLRLLGILTAVYQRDPRREFIALEEPENSLHPGALAVLSDVLKEAARRRQVLITTQSPDLISRFGVDELRIVERNRGVTTIGPVEEVQRGTIEEQLFSAGDLLRIEGLRGEPVGQ